MPPVVSVIIPTYNRSNLLREAIESVLRQTYRDVEIIVVDDGSTDDTPVVVRSLSGPIRYLFQENRGRSAARNHGLEESRGRYILFLDSDDLLLPHALELLVTQLETKSAIGAVYSNCIYCDLEGRDLQPVEIEKPVAPSRGPLTILEQLALTNVIGAIHGTMVRREWLARLDSPCFDESLEVLEDADVWYRLAALGCPFHYLNALTGKYRMHAGNTIVSGAYSCGKHWQSYVRSRMKIFHSDSFLGISPKAQTVFLYTLLLHPEYGDIGVRDEILSSDRFQQLSGNVQAEILYLAAIDDLRSARPMSIVRARLGRAAHCRPFSLKYQASYRLVAVNSSLLLAFVLTTRRLRGLASACQGFFANKTLALAGSEKRLS